MLQLLVTASVVPTSLVLVTLIKEAISSTETSVLRRATQRNIPEDTILHLSDSWMLKVIQDGNKLALNVPSQVSIMNKQVRNNVHTLTDRL
jgi:hypothetical protein